MRISDWSSDVCSSDLVDDEGGQRRRRHGADADAGDRPARGLAAAQNEPALYRADRRHIGKADADADADAVEDHDGGEAVGETGGDKIGRAPGGARGGTYV